VAPLRARFLGGRAARAEPATLATRALAALAPSQRAVVALSLVAGMTHAEIAPVVGVRPSTVASRLRAARRTMRDALSGAEPDALIVGE
jgi:DNA-directed RNA polymerase specialized sigma24 family protein